MHSGQSSGWKDSITTSVATVGANITFTVSGYDIYGYPMTNAITVTSGSTSGTTVNGTKAFKYITSVTPSVTDTTAEIAAMARGAALPDVAKLVEQGLFKREYRDHRLEWMIKSGGVEVVLKGLERNNIRFTPEYEGSNYIGTCPECTKDLK